MFQDRTDAGHELASRLGKYAGRDDVIVLALPRGGVPVAYEVARSLDAPLDVFVVRKLGVPGFEELAMGAIASGGVRVLNEVVTRQLPEPKLMIEAATTREKAELERREAAYRQGRAAPDLRGRIVIVVDDGLATGATMRAAVAALRKLAVQKIVVAVPVGSRETCAELRAEAEEVVCAKIPDYFGAVGEHYEDFSQTTDAEVREFLAAASRKPIASR